MKALLISNPNSTTQQPELFRHLIPVLRNVPGLHLHAQFTHHAGHATTLCEGLTRADYDVVIAVGGDGTVNEVINGLLGPVPAAGEASKSYHDIPALAAIPTGSANVFARALGFPPEPIQATETLAHTLRHGLTRTIDMGTWNDKWFAVNAGFGIDADVIANMERVRQRGFSATPLRYLRVTARAWRRLRKYPPNISVSAVNRDGERRDIAKLPVCMASNTNPWSFFGPLPVVTNPRNSFDVGLGLFGVTRLDGIAGATTMLQMLGANLPRFVTSWLNERTFVFDDTMEATLTCAKTQRFQVDGEYAGDFTSVTLGAIPEAIEVYAPADKVTPTPMSWVRLALSFFDIRL